MLSTSSAGTTVSTVEKWSEYSEQSEYSDCFFVDLSKKSPLFCTYFKKTAYLCTRFLKKRLRLWASPRHKASFLLSVCTTIAPSENRDVAQLVAHYVRDVGVGRSSRLIPTKGQRKGVQLHSFFCFHPHPLHFIHRKFLLACFAGLGRGDRGRRSCPADR